ncbi:MAG: hypothetical protein E3K36_11825 [Candidatus Brocadia sp.]|nr:hypothetical protein [Candidatus Brocadia sp.]
MAVGEFVGLLNVIVTVFLGLVGFYLTHSFRRQVKQKTADGRMRSYAELWEITGVARSTRIKEWHAEELKGPLTQDERMKLYVALTKWYYENGNGMVLGDNTRRLYLTAKDNLICPDEALKPSKLYEILKKLSDENRIEKRGHLSIRQLSLLRARMRADLEVYGVLYFGEL